MKIFTLLYLIILGFPFCVYSNEIEQAIINGDISSVQQLINNNSDLINNRNTGRSTLLHLAIDHCEKYIAKFLLSKKQSLINAQNNQGSTPLHYAVKNKNKDLIKFLIEHDASPDINNFQEPPQSPYDLAQKIYRSSETVDKLLKKPSSPQESKKKALLEKLQKLSLSSASSSSATTAMVPLILATYQAHLKQKSQTLSKDPVKSKTSMSTTSAITQEIPAPNFLIAKTLPKTISLTAENKKFLKKFIENEIYELDDVKLIETYQWICDNKNILIQEKLLNTNDITTIEKNIF